MANPVGTELVQVVGVTPTGGLSGVSEYFTIAQIAAGGGGGGGGISTQAFLSSGTTGTAALSQFYGVQSPTTGAKTITIPTSTGSLKQIIVSDLQGTANTYNITVTPASGSIIGPSVCSGAFQSLTFLDTTSGWASI